MFLEQIAGCIGVWGYGVVGQAVVRFLVSQKKQIALFDTDSIKLSDNFLSHYNIKLFSGNQLPEFFNSCSVIIPSPGIDLSPYTAFSNTYLSELDLFYDHWDKPVIAVTGSVGKTSITTILGMLLNQNGHLTAVGGNIGIGSLDLIVSQDSMQYALLELSSFQLEHTQRFVPHIAIITNLYPNHLDRHKNIDEYWDAKARICVQQSSQDLTIIDWALRNRIRDLNISHTIWYIGDTPLQSDDILFPHEAYWYRKSKTEIKVVRELDYQTHKVSQSLFSATLDHNALIIYATLVKLTNNNIFALDLNCDNLSLEHRREVVGTWHHVLYVNDSKATSTQAMLAAVNHYSSRPILLLMGGLSKGVNRMPIFEQLPDSVQEIICFGAEAEILYKAACAADKKASAYTNLYDAVTYAVSIAPRGSVVLFSPAGSSFDLYKNYEERGTHFKSLINELCNKKDCRITTTQHTLDT